MRLSSIAYTDGRNETMTFDQAMKLDKHQQKMLDELTAEVSDDEEIEGRRYMALGLDGYRTAFRCLLRPAIIIVKHHRHLLAPANGHAQDLALHLGACAVHGAVADRRKRLRPAHRLSTARRGVSLFGVYAEACPWLVCLPLAG